MTHSLSALSGASAPAVKGRESCVCPLLPPRARTALSCESLLVTSQPLPRGMPPLLGLCSPMPRTAPSCSYFLTGLLFLLGNASADHRTFHCLCPRRHQSAGQLFPHLGRKKGRSPWAEAVLGQHSLNVVPSIACYIHSPSSLRGPLFLTSVTRATRLPHEIQSGV